MPNIVRAARKMACSLMKSITFDAAEYLDTPERQADYLALALESGDPTTHAMRFH